MPSNHSRVVALSARLSRLLIEAQETVDALLAEPMNDAQGSLYLGLPALTLATLLDHVTNRIYVLEQGDLRHIAKELAIAKAIVNTASVDPLRQ